MYHVPKVVHCDTTHRGRLSVQFIILTHKEEYETYLSSGRFQEKARVSRANDDRILPTRLGAFLELGSWRPPAGPRFCWTPGRNQAVTPEPHLSSSDLCKQAAQQALLCSLPSPSQNTTVLDTRAIICSLRMSRQLSKPQGQLQPISKKQPQQIQPKPHAVLHQTQLVPCQSLVTELQHATQQANTVRKTLATVRSPAELHVQVALQAHAACKTQGDLKAQAARQRHVISMKVEQLTIEGLHESFMMLDAIQVARSQQTHKAAAAGVASVSSRMMHTLQAVHPQHMLFHVQLLHCSSRGGCCSTDKRHTVNMLVPVGKLVCQSYI